jgi:hypothetical protein
MYISNFLLIQLHVPALAVPDSKPIIRCAPKSRTEYHNQHSLPLQQKAGKTYKYTTFTNISIPRGIPLIGINLPVFETSKAKVAKFHKVLVISASR